MNNVQPKPKKKRSKTGYHRTVYKVDVDGFLNMLAFMMNEYDAMMVLNMAKKHIHAYKGNDKRPLTNNELSKLIRERGFH